VRKDLLAGREKGKKTMRKRSDGVGRCCSSCSGCACERHKEGKSTKKEAAMHWALRLCIAVDDSRRLPAPSVFTTAETERRLQRGYEIP
jgi:hypothetical protein